MAGIKQTSAPASSIFRTRLIRHSQSSASKPFSAHISFNDIMKHDYVSQIPAEIFGIISSFLTHQELAKLTIANEQTHNSVQPFLHDRKKTVNDYRLLVFNFHNPGFGDVRGYYNYDKLSIVEQYAPRIVHPLVILDAIFENPKVVDYVQKILVLSPEMGSYASFDQRLRWMCAETEAWEERVPGLQVMRTRFVNNVDFWNSILPGAGLGDIVHKIEQENPRDTVYEAVFWICCFRLLLMVLRRVQSLELRGDFATGHSPNVFETIYNNTFLFLGPNPFGQDCSTNFGQPIVTLTLHSTMSLHDIAGLTVFPNLRTLICHDLIEPIGARGTYSAGPSSLKEVIFSRCAIPPVYLADFISTTQVFAVARIPRSDLR
jgi:hypothetical protein